MKIEININILYMTVAILAVLIIMVGLVVDNTTNEIERLNKVTVKIVMDQGGE